MPASDRIAVTTLSRSCRLVIRRSMRTSGSMSGLNCSVWSNGGYASAEPAAKLTPIAVAELSRERDTFGEVRIFRLQIGIKIRPEGSNGGEWHTVEQPRGHCQQQGDLRGQGERLRLRLLQDGADAASSLDRLPCPLVGQLTEAGENLQLEKLRVFQLQPFRKSLDRGALSLAADTADAQSDVDGRLLPLLEQL